MLGPLICHTIRPLVFRAGLWTIELEKSWNHLFDMVATLMKRGYPGHHTNVAETNPVGTVTRSVLNEYYKARSTKPADQRSKPKARRPKSEDQSPKTEIHINLGFGLRSLGFGLQSLGIGLWSSALDGL